METIEDKTIGITCCDYCTDYTVGDRRCSCGNRRVCIEIEGNVIDGFFHYAVNY